jgi:hypothetical protein
MALDLDEKLVSERVILKERKNSFDGSREKCYYEIL